MIHLPIIMHSEFKIKMKHILFITLLFFFTGCEWWQDKTPNTATSKIEKEDTVDEDENIDEVSDRFLRSSICLFACQSLFIWKSFASFSSTG